MTEYLFSCGSLVRLTGDAINTFRETDEHGVFDVLVLELTDV